MIIKKTAEYISQAVYRNIDVNENTLEVDVIERRLSVLMIYISFTLTLVAVGIIFDNIWQLVIATIGMIVIRHFSGGNHFDHPDACYIVTTSIILVPAFASPIIPVTFDPYILTICLIAYIIYSPHEYKNNKDYWIKKALLITTLCCGFLLTREILYIGLLLIVDQMIGNKKFKK